MKIRITRQEIRRILGGRYEDLHRDFLGVDLCPRSVDPIDQNVFYVTYQDSVGWNLFYNDSPAMCDYRDGSIYCYYDLAIPLTEVRLVHEFVHRAARFQKSIGVWSSGVVVNSAWTRVNEGLTEYLTSLICGERYEKIVRPGNRYLIYLKAVKKLEDSIGREALLEAYLNHDVRVLEEFVVPAGKSGMYRFR